MPRWQACEASSQGELSTLDGGRAEHGTAREPQKLRGRTVIAAEVFACLHTQEEGDERNRMHLK